MSNDESAAGPDGDDIVAETTSLLETFGLTTYEAKCFVALTRIRHGTARELAEVADVPRPRVYDSVESLQERGLADVQDSKPRQFRAPEPRDAVETVRREYGERLDRLEGLLPRLRSPEPRDERAGVWVVEGNDAVSDRLAGLADDATDELLVVVAVESLLTDELRASLSAADDRGVAVTVGSPSRAIRETVADVAPGATVVETWTWWEDHPIRPGEISSILMADGSQLLVSSDLETDLPGVDRHSAVWTDDERAPLVGLMRPLLASAIRSGLVTDGSTADGSA
ncbi:TrmB family transcriptional regulator [Halosimplex amylolyticum]|uniref:TrmB family transcriptional regulator n=1 Tax=Halosimplex amylolyticum TaxID=3396616 RepID=UPI003F57DBF1